MPKITIDTVTNNNKTAREIVVEAATGADVGAISPARALQVGGQLVSQSNPVPVAAPARSFFSNYSTATRAGTGVIKNSPGRLVSLDIFSIAAAGTANLYLQFFDATAVPSASTRCRRFFPILADSTLLVYGATDLEMDFATGIVAAISTTPDTYTAATQGVVDNIFFAITFR